MAARGLDSTEKKKTIDKRQPEKQHADMAWKLQNERAEKPEKQRGLLREEHEHHEEKLQEEAIIHFGET
eukprot:7989009-Pyramimonas_sp.AAC.1